MPHHGASECGVPGAREVSVADGEDDRFVTVDVATQECQSGFVVELGGMTDFGVDAVHCEDAVEI